MIEDLSFFRLFQQSEMFVSVVFTIICTENTRSPSRNFLESLLTVRFHLALPRSTVCHAPEPPAATAVPAAPAPKLSWKVCPKIVAENMNHSDCSAKGRLFLRFSDEVLCICEQREEECFFICRKCLHEAHHPMII